MKQYGIKGILQTIAAFGRALWYGRVNIYIKEMDRKYRVYSQSSSRQHAMDGIGARYWESERRKFKSGEYKRSTDSYPLERLDHNSLTILADFQRKWLPDGLGRDDVKEKFYLWMEKNYLEHLIAHQKHKQKHFKNTLKRKRKESRIMGINKVAALASKVTAFIVSVFSIANYEDVISAVTSFFIPESGRTPISQLQKIIFIIGILALILIVVYCFVRLFSSTEYEKQKNMVNDNRGTWLRHQEAITNYQKEMMEYLWNIGSYGECVLESNKECMFMYNIKEIWRANAAAFQQNMKNNETREKEGEKID